MGENPDLIRFLDIQYFDIGNMWVFLTKTQLTPATYGALISCG